MRILLLSGNTGEGHNSAAKALKEYFEEKGCHCDIHDGLQYMRFSCGNFISWGHITIYRKFPFIFAIGYAYAQWLQRHRPYGKMLEKRAKKLRHRLSPHRKRLKDFIENGNYDAVIAVHSFIALMTGELRACGALDIPSFFLSTDYSCYPGVNQMDLDAWLIAHQYMVPKYLSLGIPGDKLVPVGIPIRKEFMESHGKAEVRRQLNLPQDKKIVVLSCGSMGANKMGRLVVTLSETMPDDALLVAICGNNKVLEKNLRRLVRSKNVLILGFVERMSSYMDAADLFITKPGGLSTSEAMHKRVPTILVQAVPGCETGNLEFLTKIGCAAYAKGTIAAAKLVNKALNDDNMLENLSKKCEAEFSENASEAIYNVVMSHPKK